MKKITLVLVLICLFTLGYCEETKGINKITSANELLLKMDEAVHIDVLKDVKSISYKMSREIPVQKAKGIYEFMSIEDKVIQINTMNNGKESMAFDGQNFWAFVKNREIMNFTTSWMNNLKSSSLAVMKKPKSFYASIVLGAIEKFEGKECYLLLYKSKEHSVSDVKVYIDRKTFLIAGTIRYTVDNANAQTPADFTYKTVYHTYKKCINGFLVPETMTEDYEGLIIKQTLVDIKFNPEIDENIFKKH